MKYFEFNNASVGAIATGWDIDNEFTGNNNVDFTTRALDVKEIKSRIERMWNNKEEFKKLIATFNKINDEEKLKLLVGFYSKNFEGLNHLLIERFEKEYPIKKQIKSSLIFRTVDGDYFKTELKVLTKNGVKLNGFKTYTKEDLDALIKEGKIAIIGYSIGKQAKVNGVVNRVDVYLNKFLPEFGKTEIEELCEKYPGIVNEVLADVTAEELKVDYELLYLPAYKTCLKYLAGCARASKESMAQKKKNLNKQIAELDVETKKFSEIEKHIADTAKGR